MLSMSKKDRASMAWTRLNNVCGYPLNQLFNVNASLTPQLTFSQH